MCGELADQRLWMILIMEATILMVVYRSIVWNETEPNSARLSYPKSQNDKAFQAKEEEHPHSVQLAEDLTKDRGPP